MNRRNALINGFAVTAGLLGFAGCDTSSTTPSGFTRNGLKAGLQAPNIAGLDLDGNAMSLGESKGKVVVLEFWSPT